MSMGDMYYAYHMGVWAVCTTAYHMTVLLTWFITEGTVGLSISTHYASSINEGDKLSHKVHVSENRHNLKFLKHIKMWSSSKELLTNVLLKSGIDKLGYSRKPSNWKCGQFILFVSLLHYMYSLLFDKSSQCHAVAHIFKLWTKHMYTKK